MKRLRLSEDFGLINIFVLVGMLLIAIALPVATKLVQQNQENRGKAAENNIVNGLCGSENGISRYFFQISDEWLCEKGTATEPVGVVDLSPGQTSNVTWKCQGANGGSIAECSATQIYAENVNGYCGSKDGSILKTKPEISLCIAGIADEVTDQIIDGRHDYSWHCQGLHGGITISCHATGELLDSLNIGSSTSLAEPYLYFSSNTNTCSTTQPCVVTVKVDSGSEKIGGVDIVMNYDSSKLTLLSAKKSDSFVFNHNGDDCVITSTQKDKFIATCFISSSENTMQANGNLMDLVFLGKEKGTTSLNFECVDNNTLESNIIANNQDVISCKKNGTSILNIVSPPGNDVIEVGEPHLYFSQDTNTCSTTQPCVVTVKVDSGSEKINGVDIVLPYDPSLLTLLSAEKSDSFVFNNVGGNCAFLKKEEGKLVATCYTNNSLDSLRSNGSLIDLTFIGKKEGNTDLKFDCIDGNTLESNIVSSNVQSDIISCQANGISTVNILTPPNRVPELINSTDINQDGVVNSIDFSIAKNAVLSQNSKADVNLDGIVNSIDLNLIRRDLL